VAEVGKTDETFLKQRFGNIWLKHCGLVFRSFMV
jgi:hypothetical protein